MSDWYHHDAFGLFYHETNTPHAALPVSTVLAGKGTFSCDSATDPLCTGQQERHEIVFEKGKKYKIGLVNTASLLTYKFWIDGHIFTVVETDLVPIKPYVTDVLILGIGKCNRSAGGTQRLISKSPTLRSDHRSQRLLHPRLQLLDPRNLLRRRPIPRLHRLPHRHNPLQPPQHQRPAHPARKHPALHPRLPRPITQLPHPHRPPPSRARSQRLHPLRLPQARPPILAQRLRPTLSNPQMGAREPDAVYRLAGAHTAEP